MLMRIIVAGVVATFCIPIYAQAPSIPVTTGISGAASAGATSNSGAVMTIQSINVGSPSIHPASSTNVGSVGGSAPVQLQPRDGVVNSMELGIKRESGSSLPMNIKVEGTGISVPKCFGASREGETC